MGLDPRTWGRRFWPVIHVLAKMYNVKPPTEEGVARKEAAYRGMFENLPYLLPCEGCQMNAEFKYKKLPPPLEGTIGTNALFEWSVAFHNLVNEATGKGAHTMEQAEEDFRRDYLLISTIREDADANDQKLRDQKRIKSLEEQLADTVSAQRRESDDASSRQSTHLALLITLVVVLALALLSVLFVARRRRVVVQ
jgi:hypothetical protein